MQAPEVIDIIGPEVGEWEAQSTESSTLPSKKKKKGPFSVLGVNDDICLAISKMGYKQPTPIQRRCIRPILSGRDVVAMARTGSGKSAAFLIPMIQILGQHSTTVGIRGIVVSPTRELALQTFRFCRQLSRYSDLRSQVIVGGSSMEKDFHKLANNPDVVIATPGRLVHHTVEADVSLKKCQHIVFDEADRLFELGFEEQLRKILDSLVANRQCVMMSATLPSSLFEFSRAGLREPDFVRLDVEHTLSDQLELAFLCVRKDEKLASLLSVLRHLLTNKESALIFVATRHHVEFFDSLLGSLGFLTTAIYGSMDQRARLEALDSFRKGMTKIMVVTDVAARGLDMPIVSMVIHFDFPASPKLFIHRSGRTARAGRPGRAVSLVSHADLPYAVELMLFLGRKFAGPSDSTDMPSADDEGITFLGGFPVLDDEIESVNRILNNAVDIKKLYNSMQASYGLYHKTRTPASKESVRRARTLVAEWGGAEFLTDTVHPCFLRTSTNQNNRNDIQNHVARLEFVRDLRTFRPTPGGKGSPIGGLTTNKINKLKEISNMNTMLNKQTAMVTQTNIDGPPFSNEGENFYLSVERPTSDSVFALANDRPLNLVPDDANAARKVSHMMKWEAKKMKYVMTPVDHAGKPQRIKRKNESGVTVWGEVQKSDTYKKWMSATKRRIQSAGEREDQDGVRAAVERFKAIRSKSENGPNDVLEEVTENALPHGVADRLQDLLSQKELTHKEKRTLNRLQKLKTDARTEAARTAGTGIKTIAQLKKDKKDKMQRQLRSNVKLRRAASGKSFRKHMAKRKNEMVLHGAKTRAKEIIKTKKR